MRILFLEDDGLTDLIPYVRHRGDTPVVLRTGVYDEWHPRENLGAHTEVLQLPKDADTATVAAAAAALRPDALVSLALLDKYVARDAAVATQLQSTLGIPVVANTPAAAALANNKHATKQLLARYGLPVTEALEIVSCDQAISAGESLGYPIVIKRNDGYSGIGMRLLEDQAQLKTYYRRSPGPMIAEAFVAGLELSVDVLAWQGACRAMSIVSKGETDRNLRRHPIYRLRVAPHPLSSALADRVRMLAERTVQLLGLTGVAECEMILHPQRGPMVLEVNPRIAGTLRLSVGASGINAHRCLIDMVRGDFDVSALRPQPAVTAQVPLSVLHNVQRETLLTQGEVRHIKDIDWMPSMGIRASVMVQATTSSALAQWLQQFPQYEGFPEAARKIQQIFGLDEQETATAS